MSVGVFAYQAGAAEAFVPVIKHLSDSGEKVDVYTGAPARRTFEAAGIESADIETRRFPIRRLENVRAFLTGTSWNPDLESAIWTACRETGVRSVAFVDNWVNYAGRFSGGSVPFSIAPDVIAVVDEGMRVGLMRAGCESGKAHIVGHPALECLACRRVEMDRSFRAQIGSDESEFLILWAADGIYHGGPPEYPQPGDIGYCDAELLEKSIAALNAMAEERSIRLVLRRHPASPDSSLPQLLKTQARFAWSKGDHLPKIPSILACDAIMGGSSMILLEAAVLGKRVISCLRRYVMHLPILHCNSDLIDTAETAEQLTSLLRMADRKKARGANRFQTGEAVAKLIALMFPAELQA